MALYFYQALSKEGKKVSGSLDATSVAHVKDQLVAQGLYPIEITSSDGSRGLSLWQRLTARGMSKQDLIMFTRQLSVILKAGVPLLQALELLVDQFSKSTRTILVSIKDDVKEGTALAVALKKYPKLFDPIYVQLVRAGEASGHLEVILDRLTDYLIRKQETAKRIRGALMQPMIQLVFAVIIVGALLYFVVPMMVEMLINMDVPLPTITIATAAISNFIVNYYWLILLASILIFVAYRYWKSTSSGAYTIDKIKLNIPIFGYFVRTNAIVQFSYTLGMLLQAGVNLSESLDIVVSIINNQVLAETLKAARDKIIKQGNIAQYLKQTTIFPPIAIYLISTGEKTGQLDTMLLTIAKNYEEELASWSDSLTALLNPILLIVMGSIVGIIIMAVMLPMFSIIGSINT